MLIVCGVVLSLCCSLCRAHSDRNWPADCSEGPRLAQKRPDWCEKVPLLASAMLYLPTSFLLHCLFREFERVRLYVFLSVCFYAHFSRTYSHPTQPPRFTHRPLDAQEPAVWCVYLRCKHAYRTHVPRDCCGVCRRSGRRTAHAAPGYPAQLTFMATCVYLVFRH